MTQPLCELIAPQQPPSDPSVAARVLDGLRAKAAEPGGEQHSALMTFIDADEASGHLIELIAGSSPYLRRLVERDPGFALHCLRTAPDRTLEEIIDATRRTSEEADTEAALMTALRLLKAQSALAIALADISGAWDLDRTTGALSDFADAALSAAVDWLLRQAGGEGDPTAGYVVLAMGKHGAHELNYSSDIDLIVLFDPERAALPEGAEPSTHYIRVTRKLVKVLQEPTGDGYVFRVDLRLRPDPRATGVAIALEAAAQYYESMGQNWERAAMIKARAVAGDIAAGEEFLERVAPFIWRKYLDFAAIADVQSLKRQIHAFKGHGEIAIAGHNIKLGRGGIREIEFFVQTQQLIAGGRAPHLRGNRTVAMLHTLAESDWIAPEVADEMTAAYEFLRMVEHRVQMVDDQQTHELPKDAGDLERLARFCGFDSTDAFSERLRHHLETVQAHYAALFEAAPALGDEHGSLVFTGGEDDPETLETLIRMGFERPSDVSAAIRGWHFGRFAATRSAKARERLTEIMPVLLDALARTGQPDQAFIAFDRFLAGLPAGVQLFSLLKANPKLLSLVADILGTAPRLAGILSRQPKVLDAVLDPGFFGPLPRRADLDAVIDMAIPAGGALEEALDRARVIGHEQHFRIGVRLLSASVGVTEAGRAYSGLAASLIGRLFAVVAREFEAVHGRLSGGAVSVVAMGKLGGREMTASSDLDLMLIYDHDADAKGSDGAKPLTPGQYYIRLTQRLINALSVQTAEGGLYEVDMRLRPSGNQGPVATHISSFIDYHAASAWTWEKLALTRARPIAGDPALIDRIEVAVRNTLCQRRDHAETASDVVGMRGRIAKEKPADGIWDLKMAPGGLVDLEFIVQFLQIVHAERMPQILDQNSEGGLEKLAAEGVIEEAAARDLLDAHRLMGALTQVLRLCLSTGFAPDAAPQGLKSLLLRAADVPDFSLLESALSDAHIKVKSHFDQIVGGQA